MGLRHVKGEALEDILEADSHGEGSRPRCAGGGWRSPEVPAESVSGGNCGTGSLKAATYSCSQVISSDTRRCWALQVPQGETGGCGMGGSHHPDNVTFFSCRAAGSAAWVLT